MSEEQAYIALPEFITQFAKIQYEAGSQIMYAGEGGISRWPEAVQYLLRNYDQSTHVATDIMDLREIRQDTSESENALAMRIKDDVDRRGNVHSDEEISTILIDGMDP